MTLYRVVLKPTTHEIEFSGSTIDNKLIYLYEITGLTTTTTTAATTTTTTTAATTTTTTTIQIKLGLIYNEFVITDSRNIAPSGWHVPTETEIDTLINGLGGYNIETGKKIRDDDINYWTGLDGATNSSGFSSRGSGYRNGVSGAFGNLYAFGYVKTSTLAFGTSYKCLSIGAANSLSVGNVPRDHGHCIRLVKDDDTYVSSMTDNDGNVYDTVKIGDQVWITSNLISQKFRNGDTITEVTDNATWAALLTPGLCAYDNDWDYV